jgi:hypothetical protein
VRCDVQRRKVLISLRAERGVVGRAELWCLDAVDKAAVAILTGGRVNLQNEVGEKYGVLTELQRQEEEKGEGSEKNNTVTAH